MTNANKQDIVSGYYFETMNRRLENFLFLHDIRWMCQCKNEDGMTVWKYRNTPDVQFVVQEYRLIQHRINKEQHSAPIMRAQNSRKGVML